MRQPTRRSSGSQRGLCAVTVVTALCALQLAFVVPVTAQEDGAGGADLLYPAPVRTFQAEGGYRFFEDGEDDSLSFYRVSYRGQLIDSRGEPFTSLEHVDLLVPQPVAVEGDRSDLILRLEDARGSIGGDLFEGDGAMPLALRGLSKYNLRGAAYLSTDLDGTRLKAAVGIESPPFRIPGMSRLGAANWLILGLMGEHADATDEAGADDDYALLTGRIFIGKALGMHRRPDSKILAQQMAATFLEKAPTHADAVALAQLVRQIPANRLSAMQSWLLDLVDAADPQGDWRQQVLEFTEGLSEAVSEQPTVSLYLEGSGWLADTSQPGEPKRRGLLSLTADYWPLPGRDDVILRARYDWGFERLQPDVRVNQFTISAVIQF